MSIDKAITYLKKKAPKGEFLAYINPKEAAMLKKAGGSGELVNGIPSYRSAKGMASKEKSRSYKSPSRKTSPSFKGPSELGTSTRKVNRITAPAATTYIGGKKYNVTPNNRDERNRAELKQQLMRQPLGGNKIDKFGNTKKSLFRGGGGGIGSLLASLFGLAMGIPGLGLLTGGFGKLKKGLGSLGDTLGDFREKTTGFKTQAEYDQAMFDRRQQKRLDKLFAAKDRGYNQIGFGDFTKKTMDFTPGQQAKIDDLLAQGYTPSTARNVLTGRDLKGFTDSRGLQTPQTFSDPFANTVGTTTKANNLSNDAVSSTTPINNLQQRVDVMNQFDFPFNYSADDLQARAKRAMTQPGMQIELAPYEKGVPQELQFFDGRPFTAKAYNPYKVNTQQQGINTIDVGYPSNDLMAGLTKMQQKMLAGPQKNLRNIMGISDEEILNNISPFNDPEDPATLEEVQTFYGADGGLASMFTRRG